MTEFFEEVESTIAQRLAPLGFVYQDDRQSQAFGDALVILEGGNVRVRVVRDRGQIFLDLGSIHDPNGALFDSTVVMEHLQPVAKLEVSTRIAERSLEEITEFLSTSYSELQRAFSLQHYASTITALRVIQARFAERMG